MTTSENSRLKEYELLRDEILHADRLVVHVISMSLGLIGIIIGQGVVSGNPYIFLIPFPIIWASSRYVEDKRWLIWVIAAYLRRHLEGSDGPSWETWAFAFRSKVKRTGGRFCPGQNVMLAECILFNIMSLSCAGLFIGFAYGTVPSTWIYLMPIPLLLSAAIAVSTVTGHVKLCRQGRAGTEMANALPTARDFANALNEIGPMPAAGLYAQAQSSTEPTEPDSDDALPRA